MTHLAIDTHEAPRLARSITGTTSAFDSARQLLASAQQLADLPAEVDGMLDDIERLYAAVAAAIERAVETVLSFRLARSAATNAAFVPLAESGASLPSTPWNLVTQEASHNSYAVPGGIEGLYAVGVRAFELDIHRGAPTDLTSPLGLVGIAVDHFDHRGGRQHDWRVYHVSGSSQSEYDYLTEGLEAVATLPSTDPITVFIDNKDDFAGSHTPEQFDAVARSVLGPRLFTPAELGPAPGWPTVAELQGKVMIVLTDNIDGYDPRHRAAFVAPRPEFAEVDGVLKHVPDHAAVFYNIAAHELSTRERQALAVTPSVVRTYVSPRCEGLVAVNYRAVDVTPDDVPCAG